MYTVANYHNKGTTKTSPFAKNIPRNLHFVKNIARHQSKLLITGITMFALPFDL